MCCTRTIQFLSFCFAEEMNPPPPTVSPSVHAAPPASAVPVCSHSPAGSSPSPAAAVGSPAAVWSCVPPAACSPYLDKRT